MKKIFMLILLFVASSTFAGWTFSNGTFSIKGDTSFYLNSQSSLFIQDFGYTVNGGEFIKIPESDFTKALSFKDGDNVTFMKKGLFLNYYAQETGLGIYTISNYFGGITVPFSFSLNVVNPSTPSGQPLPAVVISMFIGLFGISTVLLKKKLNFFC